MPRVRAATREDVVWGEFSKFEFFPERPGPSEWVNAVSVG